LRNPSARNRKIVDSGGDYLVTVKDNQSTLHRAISQEFTAQNAVFSPLSAAAT
jgi:predicted transposase YbfD/YdcC